jgi:hypothetical protein
MRFVPLTAIGFEHHPQTWVIRDADGDGAPR